ncbi:MAG: alpha/beta hydrolase-fold protein [Opitutaceae bacterium]
MDSVIDLTLLEDVMKIPRFAASFLVALACASPSQTVYAQATAAAGGRPQVVPSLKYDPMPSPNSGEWKKSGSTHRQATFPQTTEDGRFWFQMKAPEAKVVQLGIGGRRYAYEKDANGVWNAFVPYPGPGMKTVTVYVDGVAMPEPGSNMIYANGWKAVVESPAPKEDFYAMKDVAHGDVREHWFKSKVAGTFRRMFVYTPPGYDPSGNTRYPVLYLQHGAGEMEQEWTHSGLANAIVDNLIAQKQATPMIIVMNNGFVNRPGEVPTGLLGGGARGGGAPAAGGAPAPAAGAAPAARGPGTMQFTAFEDMLLNEVIPDIDRNFRTIADRKHRAMAGLSMGGMQTRSIAPKHLDAFSYIGIFSGGVISPETITDVADFKKKVKLVFMSYGSRENFASANTAAEALNKAGIKSVSFVSEDTAHDWQTWRRSLHQFAPMIFK